MQALSHIGTSGWSYPDWKGLFYPRELKSTDWLAYYASKFKTLEINSSFYHLPKKNVVENWVNKVPNDFLFCPKMSRYLTHIQKLQEPKNILEKFFDAFEPMQGQIGLILLQLPPSVVFDYDIVVNLFAILKEKYCDNTFAIEARHKSWLAQESIDLMIKYDIAFVISQSGVGFPYAEFVTSHNVYLRFHGPQKLYDSSYTANELKRFAALINNWMKERHQVWAFFNNCYHTYAIQNAFTLETSLNS
jgi:uncharacterized protein YecE (DUF72 family)